MTVMDFPTAPARSLEQRQEALEYANRVRVYRAEFKRELKAGRKTVADVRAVLTEGRPHALMENMKVRELLLAIPGFGPYKVRSLLWAAQASPSKTLVGLSHRQRQQLSLALRDYDKSYGRRAA
jgi:hypothetical protein